MSLPKDALLERARDQITGVHAWLQIEHRYDIDFEHTIGHVVRSNQHGHRFRGTDDRLVEVVGDMVGSIDGPPLVNPMDLLDVGEHDLGPIELAVEFHGRRCDRTDR